MREAGQSPVVKLSHEVAPLKLFAEITPTIKSVSVSLVGLQSDLENLKSLQPSEVFYAPSHGPTIQMAGDITEMKEIAKQILLKVGKPSEKGEVALESEYEVSVRDREIRINGYFVGKPHAVGSNLEFFEYVRRQPSGTKVERKNLLDSGGGDLKQQLKQKRFNRILTDLGFKGQILKAFFPKRGKDALIYRGDKITKADLEKAGVKTSLFLKELEHTAMNKAMALSSLRKTPMEHIIHTID